MASQNFITSSVPSTMSSREIAELAGKTHAHVLRDVDALLKTLNPELALGFKTSTYKDSTGKENRVNDPALKGEACG